MKSNGKRNVPPPILDIVHEAMERTKNQLRDIHDEQERLDDKSLVKYAFESSNQPQINIYIDQKDLVSITDRSKTFELYPGGVKLIRVLSEHNSYIQTKQIITLSRAYNTDGSVRKATAKVNRILKNGLDLTDDVIIGKRGRGYMINGMYRITFTK